MENSAWELRERGERDGAVSHHFLYRPISIYTDFKSPQWQTPLSLRKLLCSLVGHLRP